MGKKCWSNRNSWRIVGRFGKNGSCVLYFDAKGIVDGRRRNKIRIDDVFDGGNFYIFDRENVYIFDGGNMLFDGEKTYIFNGGNMLFDDKKIDIYSVGVGIEFVSRRLFDDGKNAGILTIFEEESVYIYSVGVGIEFIGQRLFDESGKDNGIDGVKRRKLVDIFFFDGILFEVRSVRVNWERIFGRKIGVGI